MNREKQTLDAELQAARQVQELLLPSAGLATPGFTVDSAYLPVQQVGGDFYWSRVAPDGSLLVVVGDVCGKGLKAAMLVSVVVGALERESSNAPGGVLAGLNSALVHRMGGGFVTACCARLALDGSVTMANAGHLAPYCDGAEVPVEAGLPLGVVEGVAYVETPVRGSRFTLVSDGVVEAENHSRELFGFPRTREISTTSAQEIADAAKAWGQNDDITVVTVRRTPCG